MLKRNLVVVGIVSLVLFFMTAAFGQSNQRKRTITKPKTTKIAQRKSRAAADHPLMDDWARKKTTRKSKGKNRVSEWTDILARKNKAKANQRKPNRRKVN